MTDQTIAVVDCETTGLNPTQDRVYEIAAIIRRPGEPDVEHHWWIDLADLAHLDLSVDGPNATALRVGRFWDRHPQASLAGFVVASTTTEGTWTEMGVHREADVAAELAEILEGAALAGVQIGSFDAPFLAALLARHGLKPTWSYRHLELSSYAAAAAGLPVSPGLGTLLEAFGIAVDPAQRHTALGDARLERDLYDAALLRVRSLMAGVTTSADERARAKILTDLDRCVHGRHRIDHCFGCPDGRSAGNPHMRPGEVIGYDHGGRPYVAPDGERTDPLCSTFEPDAWRPRDAAKLGGA